MKFSKNTGFKLFLFSSHTKSRSDDDSRKGCRELPAWMTSLSSSWLLFVSCFAYCSLKVSTQYSNLLDLIHRWWKCKTGTRKPIFLRSSRRADVASWNSTVHRFQKLVGIISASVSFSEGAGGSSSDWQQENHPPMSFPISTSAIYSRWDEREIGFKSI